MGETTQGRTGKWAKRPGGETTRGERESGRNDSGANGKVGETTRIQRDIAIRCVVSLVAHDYKDRIFKLSQLFCNLLGSLEKYQFIIRRNFAAISKNLRFPHPSPFFHVFTQNTVSIKFQVNTVVHFKGINAKVPRISKGLSSYHCTCARYLHGNVLDVIRTLNFVYNF